MANIFNQFPKLLNKFEAEAYINYRNHIFKPIMQRKKLEMKKVNKKSVYKKFYFDHKCA